MTKFNKLALISALFIPASILTMQTVNAQTLMDTGAATSISTSIDANQAVSATSIREKIKADINGKVQNIKTNQEIRNTLLEERTATARPKIGTPLTGGMNVNGASSTMPRDVRGMPIRLDNKPHFASSTMASTTRAIVERDQERIQEYRDNGKTMITSAFKMRKNLVIKEMQTALNNLSQIRERINTRIQKEQQNGKNMTDATNLLKIADGKIAAATTAINLVTDYMPSTASTTIASTTEATVNVDKARQLISDAQKTIRDARESLNKVVVAIAKAMGLKLGHENASTTTSTTVAAPSVQ